ncbi:dihydroneopterin aldolase [Jannaschia sp. W003]|uniref:dihydroneopterin aldolase n=1 Tax=Jannaschia sp. W003 TaxID=2867012 RepID=UPI0021A6A52A|nr:dihydroneopterin aldolase [Jannaschia sp. W003]UWQ21091.1 dihydroneopterin aldolase [Jannaschia sp. W003]
MPHAADRIFLREHLREVEIGAFQEERGRLQRLRFEVVAEVRADAGAVASDDVDGILSYDTLLAAIDAELGAERLRLLETLAERIAARVLAHRRAERVSVRIEKLDRGPHVLGVEIERARGEAEAATGDAPPRPVVVLLDAGALDDAALGARLDALAERAPVLVLPVPAPGLPGAAHPAAQRRIDLLAYEVAGWQLAGRDPRCLVVSSRTELDHALRTRALTVWAPARMVRDATRPPEDVAPETLARWIATDLGAVAVET